MIVLGWLGIGIGCSPQASGSPTAATAPVVPAPAPASPLQRVCADRTCGGPGTVVQQWRDAQGAVTRWEIVDSPRCPHLAGLFYDREGKNPVLLPLPFFPPGKPSEQRAQRSLHDAEIGGLTAGERIQCRP